MALITKKIKGTEDVLPKQSYRWQFIEGVMREEAKAYGFKEIRTPVFEHTELFARGVLRVRRVPLCSRVCYKFGSFR